MNAPKHTQLMLREGAHVWKPWVSLVLLSLAACESGASRPIEPESNPFAGRSVSVPAETGTGLIDLGSLGFRAQDGCDLGCSAFYACGGALENADGDSVSSADCADYCRTHGQQLGYACVAGLGSCDASLVDDCFAQVAAPQGDGCERGCVALEDCGRCLQDPEGDCLSVSACVSGCRADGAVGRLACLAGIGSCEPDEIDACLALSPPVEGDACDRGCAALESCGRCALDGSGGCLTAVECAASCRRGSQQVTFACLAGSGTCDEGVLDECFNLGLSDGCTLGCTALDNCGQCVPNADGVCLNAEECAAACRDAGLYTEYACVGGLESCDTGSTIACLAPSADAPDYCTEGCNELYACSYCATDENEECISLGACIAACEASANYYSYACVSEVDDCDAAALLACIESTPEPLPEGSCGACMQTACSSEVARCEMDASCDAMLRCLSACDSPDCVAACGFSEVGPALIDPGAGLIDCMTAQCASRCETPSADAACGSVAIPMDATGWVAEESTGCGLVGSWYWYADTEGTVVEDATANLPPYREGQGMCLSGSTVADPTYAAWGAGIGLDLNFDVGAQAKAPWDATARGVVGFEITTTGTTGTSPMRLLIESLPTRTDTSAPFVEFMAPGTVRVLFEDAIVPVNWDAENAGERVVPSQIYSITALIVGGGADASGFDVCVSAMRPLVSDSIGD